MLSLSILLTQTNNSAQKEHLVFMITVNENYHNLERGLKSFHLRGFCISELNGNENLEIIFQKGIGITLTQKIVDLYKETIVKKRQGYIKDNIGSLTIYLQFFNKDPASKLIIMYIDKIDRVMEYTKLYQLSKKIYNKISSSRFNSELKNICKNVIKIPKAKGIVGVFIIDKAGFLYFSKINKNRPNMANHNFQIAGFISAILIYSQDFIGGKEYGLKLEDINLGNQKFYIKTKNGVIFAYLVEKLNSSENMKRYMQICVEEFLEKYYLSYVKDFKGDLTPFHDFENVIDQYFEI